MAINFEGALPEATALAFHPIRPELAVSDRERYTRVYSAADQYFMHYA